MQRIDPMLRPVGIAAIFLILLLPGAEILWNARDLPHLGQSYDDGIYWVTAKALAIGAGYRQIFLPGEPYAVRFPPVYPLFLSLAWRAQPEFPRNISVAVMLQGALLLIHVPLLFLLFRQLGLSWRRTLLLSALVVTSTAFLLSTCTLMSEMLFDCLLFVTVLLSERSATAERGGWWALAVGVLTTATYLTRSAALPLFVAIPVFYAIRRRAGLILFFLAGALPGAAWWQLWQFSHRSQDLGNDSASYLTSYLRVIEVNGFWAGVYQQVANVLTVTADSFVVGSATVLHGVPLQPVFILAAISGGVRMARRKWRLYLIFAALYLVMIMCWPIYDVSHLGRLLLPVFPALLAGIAEEASYFAGLCEQTIRQRAKVSSGAIFWAAPRLLLVALGFILAAHNYVESRRLLMNVMARERHDQVFDARAYEWISRHAAPNTVLLAWRDSLGFLHTGVPSSRSLLTDLVHIISGPITGFEASLSRLPAQYRQALILLTESEISGSDGGAKYRDLRSRVEAIAGTRLEFETPGAVVYGVQFR
jgi:hypothetical protein